MGKRIVIIALLTFYMALLSVVTIGCTSSIVGKWESTDKQTTFEFTKDGQAICIFADEGFTFTGTYELVGSEVVKVKLEGLGSFLTSFNGGNWRYKISGSTMTIQVADTTYNLLRK